jgi:SAM-dependent methyltransferase
LSEHAAGLAPSAWVRRHAALLPATGTALDLACGSGRHVHWLAAAGLRVTAVDRDAAALQPLAAVAETLVADLEGAPWPLPDRRYDAIVVTNYLWRSLFPDVLASLAEGGVLLYETFADGQQFIGKPSRAEFLLQPGELLRLCQGLRVVAFEDGHEPGPGGGRCVQRIAAVRQPANAPGPPRYSLPVAGS